MSAGQMTALAVKNAKPKRANGVPIRTEIPDPGCPGLYLVVQPSGAKGWAVRYLFAGKSRKLTLGATATEENGRGLTLAAARKLAAAARHQLAQGIDPGARKTVIAPPTNDDDRVEVLVAEFITKYARAKTRASTAAQTEDIFRRLVLPVWRSRSIHDIRRRDIIALIESIAGERGGYMANRTLGALSKIFNWLVARDVLEASPCTGVEPPHKEIARDRILSDDEVIPLWRACDDPIHGIFGPLFKLLLLTGQRRGEVAGMRWSELDPDLTLWTLPAERTKNGHRHEVPLSTQARELIKAMPRIAGSDFIFTVDGRKPIIGFGRAKRRLAAAIGLDTEFRLHDLRRTAASGLQRVGTRVEVIERALNHISGQLSRRHRNLSAS